MIYNDVEPIFESYFEKNPKIKLKNISINPILNKNVDILDNHSIKIITNKMLNNIYIEIRGITL